MHVHTYSHMTVYSTEAELRLFPFSALYTIRKYDYWGLIDFLSYCICRQYDWENMKCNFLTISHHHSHFFRTADNKLHREERVRATVDGSQPYSHTVDKDINNDYRF